MNTRIITPAEEMTNQLKPIIIVVTILALLIGIYQLAGYNVPAGHAGVIFDPLQGGIQSSEAMEGFHLKMP